MRKSHWYFVCSALQNIYLPITLSPLSVLYSIIIVFPGINLDPRAWQFNGTSIRQASNLASPRRRYGNLGGVRIRFLFNVERWGYCSMMWGVTPSSLVEIYQCFDEIYCLHLQDFGPPLSAQSQFLSSTFSVIQTTLWMEVANFSETSVIIYQYTLHHVPNKCISIHPLLKPRISTQPSLPCYQTVGSTGPPSFARWVHSTPSHLVVFKT